GLQAVGDGVGAHAEAGFERVEMVLASVHCDGSLLLSCAPLPVRYVRGELGRVQGNLRVKWSGCMTPEAGSGQNAGAAWRAAKTVTWIVPPLFARIHGSVRCAYPLMLDLSDRLVVIIGGGAVA